jgi:outer membrane protein OmpA-like peptidoglycan-associated protein
MQKDINEPPETEESERLLHDLDILTASSLVANGELEEAEVILCLNENPPSSCAALDLLARISVRKGQLQRARQLWRAVLTKDSANEAAKEALANLATPWLALAIIKRLGTLFAVALGVALAALGVIGLYDGRNIALYSSSPQTGTTKPVCKHNKDSQVLPSNQTQKWPTIITGGIHSATNPNEMTLTFDETPFSVKCQLSETAQAIVAQVADQLRPQINDYHILVEGHTDADPMPTNNFYRDNVALGYARALVVAEVLRYENALPAGKISISSTGSDNPPFPETDETTKARNRTVVIRLTPVHKSPAAQNEGTTP